MRRIQHLGCYQEGRGHKHAGGKTAACVTHTHLGERRGPHLSSGSDDTSLPESRSRDLAPATKQLTTVGVQQRDSVTVRQYSSETVLQ